MKKFYSFLIAAILMLAIPMGMMGQTIFTLSSASSVTQDGITVTFAKGDGSTDPTWYAAGLRLYASNTVTISSDNTITGITFNWEKQGNKAFASVTANTGSYTHPSTTGEGTWSGSANTVVFTLGSSGQLQLNTFSVTAGGSTPSTYTVTFDTDGGTFVASNDFANTSNTVAAGTYTLPSATKTGYTFDGWTATGINTPVTGSYNISGNVDFTASYTQNGGGNSQTLTFDFEDESAHRTSGNNSYSNNEYSENGVDIILTYADAVTSGSPLNGSANVMGRIARNTTNSPVVLIGPIDITNWTISKIEYTTKGVTAMSQVFATSFDNSTWTTQKNLSEMPTSATTETVNNLSISGTNLYLRWTVSVSSSTGSNRDFQLDDIVITYIDSDPTIATTTTITAPNNFNTDLHNGTSAGTLTASVTETASGDAVSGATVTWSSSDETVATISANGAVTLVAVGTTTITASYAGVEDQYKPSDGTYNLTVIDSYAPGTVNNPYTVAQAIANTPSSGNVYIQGIVSSFYNTSIVGDGTNYRYYISDDGTTTTQLLVYKGKGLNQATFTNANDLLVGDEIVICGSLITYSDAPEVASGNYLTSWNRPSIQHGDYTLTVGNPQHITFTVTYGTSGVLSNGDSEDIADGTDISLIVRVADGYILNGITVTGENDQTATVTETSTAGVYTFKMPAFDATLSASASVAPAATTYTLATSIESGKNYIIVGKADSKYYAMGNDKGNNRYAYEITSDGTNATATVAAGSNVHEFTITSLATAGFYSIEDAIDPGFLYAASSGSNYLKTEETLDENHNGDWAISFDSEGSASVVASNSSYERNVMQFNNGSILFACYSSASQHPVYLYVKDETPAPTTIDLTLDTYTSNNDGWHLISSPMAGTTEVSGVTNMTSNTYDLYYFDQSQSLQWINYKSGYSPNFGLIPGKGYLYANSGNGNNSQVTLTFSGTPYSGTGTFDLDYDENATLSGWNLVGNPFNANTTIDKEEFYIMNEDGNGLIAADENSQIIAPMQGIFVQATAADQTVTFTKQTSKSNRSSVEMNLSRNSSVVDRAIVRFGSSNTLPKFQLFENSTKLYIAQDGKDYAIVGAEAQGEMPVSFKASENGIYTISVNTTEVEMNYLHLIDNITGADVDLLATPNYTFNARIDDYASRFRLVYSASNADSDNFAFVSDGQIILTEQGDAQVYDVMGRMISSHNSVNHITTEGMAAGVYVIRLTNGYDTKTQKIVVK